MRIGIDIDGVLTDIERFQLDYGSKYFFENYKSGKIQNPNGYEILDIFSCNTDQDEGYWKEYLEIYATKEKSRPFANEVIAKLKEDGHEIYIITARFLTERNDELGDKMRNIVINWLSENCISYDRIIFSPEDKRKICLENNIEIMIEDAPKNIMELSSVLPKVICFDARYNQECKGENIIRCYSWYDIYDEFKN